MADMLERCERLQRHMVGVTTLEGFVANETVYDAVLRNLEIIGEAAGKVQESTRNQVPNIPWREIIGFRHVLAHGYDIINNDLVWQIIQTRVPELREDLERNFAGINRGE